MPCQPDRQSAAFTKPTRWRTQRAILNPAPFRCRSFMPLPTCSTPLRFQNRPLSAKDHNPQLERTISSTHPQTQIAIQCHRSENYTFSNRSIRDENGKPGAYTFCRHHPLTPRKDQTDRAQPRSKFQPMAANHLPQFVASAPELLPLIVALRRNRLPPCAVFCRSRDAPNYYPD